MTYGIKKRKSKEISVYSFKKNPDKAKVGDKNFKVTTLPNEKLIAKEGKWYLVSYTNPNTKKTSYAVSDGWKVDFLNVYDNGNVAYDNPEVIPQKVRTAFENELQRETNPKEYFLEYLRNIKISKNLKDYKFYGGKLK